MTRDDHLIREAYEHRFQIGDKVVSTAPKLFDGEGIIVRIINASLVHVEAVATYLRNNNLRAPATFSRKHIQEGDRINWKGDRYLVKEIYISGTNNRFMDLCPLEIYRVKINDIKLAPTAQNKVDLSDKYGSDLEDI